MKTQAAARVALLAAVALTFSAPAAAQSATGRCGVDRRAIKTRHVSGAVARNFTVSEFLALNRPAHGKPKNYKAQLIEGGDEGQVVSLRGWLHGAALSADDSDYHIQLTASQDNCDEMVIVEVPDDHCVFDAPLAKPALRVRRFVDKALGKAPRTTYRRMTVPREVIVTGQLFYDLHHETAADPGGRRGKGKCKAGGLWEVHPIVAITLAE